MDKVPELRKKFLDERDKDCYDLRDILRLKSDDQFVLQFLNGWEGNVDKAHKAMIESLKWRKSFGINDLTEKDISEEVLQSGIIFMHGKDRKGAAMVFIVVAKHVWKGNEEKTADFRKLLALFLEKFQRENPGERMAFVYDCSGAGLSNTDINNSKSFVHLIQFCYPDILEDVYVLNFPWIFKALWTLTKALLYSQYSKKFIFPSKTEVLNYIDKNQLPTQFGGENSFEYKYIPDSKMLGSDGPSI